MNFNQWKNYAAKQDVSKVTYICGDQTTLVELVVEDIRNILNVPVTDYSCVYAHQADNIWDIASQYPLNPDTNRLTIVRNAESIDSWTELYEWLKLSRYNSKNYLVFVSNESDAQSIFSKGKRVGYVEHIEAIRNKGKFIRCSQPNDEDLVKWCESFGLTEQTAEFLISRTSSDVDEMYSVLRKIHIWNGPPSKNAVQLFCQEQALESFADYLILKDKKSAFLALKTLPEEEYLKVIAKLDCRLDYMLDIYRCTIRRMYDVDIAQTTGIKIYLIKKFKSVARDYEFSKIKTCRQLLALADMRLRSGTTTGVMESLITLW